MAEPTVVASGLTKRYGDRAVVDHLDLELHPGEIFGLLGPNGAGKTTTILMLLGLIEPSAGSMRVLGLDPTRHPLEVKRRVGYLPDSVGFYDQMTGRENLRFTARLNGLPPAEAEETIDRLLREVGLADAADRPTGTYSRGMLQRLGIADALVKDPRVLILDEPTTAIDPEGVAEMLALIRKLADERGVTVLLSSHLLHQVQAICDRVAIFVEGKVVAMGAPHELAAQGSGPEVMEVGVDAESDLEELLAPVDYVREVRRGRLPGLWIVTVERGRVSDLVALLVGKGVRLSSLRRVTDDLEVVYRRYFHPEVAHA
ncbi:MAG: ABC transporter ATP-binding protein [Acidimicrobiia bacterium]|nr:MAG: ABC transporter ATP-binding protein [Acidimicrobiia bacterium]